jgi:hypothetical protein
MARANASRCVVRFAEKNERRLKRNFVMGKDEALFVLFGFFGCWFNELTK